MAGTTSNTIVVPGRFGSYTVTKRLATTFMSVVYKAQNNQGREVAIKLGPRNEIKAEYDLMGQVSSPHIVKPVSTGCYSGPQCVDMPASFYGKPLGYLAMEFLEGITLDKYLRRPNLCHFIPEEVVDQIFKISEGLLPLWDNGNIHGDIKAYNVMDLPRGLVLFDFNIGAIYSIGAQNGYGSVVLGSLGYLAPERHLHGAVPLLSWDFFGIGALIYLLACGKSYLSARDPLKSKEQMILKSRDHDAEYNFKFLSEPWRSFMMKICHHDPNRRVADPRRFLCELEELRRKASDGLKIV